MEEGLWSRQRKRQRHCQRRERKSHFGELVQLDGSFHDWLEGRGPRGCLMDMVDDATSTAQARLGKEETIWAAVEVLRVWIGKYGVPRALYTDWKNVYKRKATQGEQLRGEVAVTQFGRMCQKLNFRKTNPYLEGLTDEEYRTVRSVFKKLGSAKSVRNIRNYRNAIAHGSVPAVDYPGFSPAFRFPKKHGKGMSLGVGGRPQVKHHFLELYDDAVAATKHLEAQLLRIKAIPVLAPR